MTRVLCHSLVIIFMKNLHTNLNECSENHTYQIISEWFLKLFYYNNDWIFFLFKTVIHFFINGTHLFVLSICLHVNNIGVTIFEIYKIIVWVWFEWFLKLCFYEVLLSPTQAILKTNKSTPCVLITRNNLHCYVILCNFFSDNKFQLRFIWNQLLL